MTRIGEYLFDDEMMHADTQNSLMLMYFSGIIMGYGHFSNPISLLSGLLVGIVAFRIHPGAQQIADDWPPEETTDNDGFANGSD